MFDLYLQGVPLCSSESLLATIVFVIVISIFHLLKIWCHVLRGTLAFESAGAECESNQRPGLSALCPCFFV